MRRTHPAVRGFDRAARIYARSRPEYPPAAIRHLARVLGIGPRRTVVDLASGTGKLTRPLLATGATVIPIEPTPGMREEFMRQLPGQPVLDGVAEAIPLPDGIADAVVVGQAFHWFRPRPALREIARVLRPGGGLGLVWNRRDESVPWVRGFTAITDRVDRNVPRTRQVRWRRPFETGVAPFGPLRQRRFPTVQHLTPEGVVDRMLSVSFIAAAPAAERHAIARELRQLLARDPDTRGRRVIDLPYRTDVYWARRRARA